MCDHILMVGSVNVLTSPPNITLDLTSADPRCVCVDVFCWAWARVHQIIYHTHRTRTWACRPQITRNRRRRCRFSGGKGDRIGSDRSEMVDEFSFSLCVNSGRCLRFAAFAVFAGIYVWEGGGGGGEGGRKASIGLMHTFNTNSESLKSAFITWKSYMVHVLTNSVADKVMLQSQHEPCSTKLFPNSRPFSLFLTSSTY